MEDSHSIHLYLPAGTPKLPSSSTTKIPEQPQGSTVTNNEEDEDGNAFAGVFDGHGGSAVAKFTGTTIHSRLASLDAYKSGEYEKALKQVFLKTDEDLRADPSFFNDPSGCTAVVGLITTDGRIIVANSGDSRSVLGYKGEAKAMSYDHKPTNKEETARITAAGGFVEFGRVNGNLALSRALGDFEFKQNYSLDAEHQIVTADPDIITHKVDGEEEFLVLACDGIWDCLSSQQVVDITRRAIAKGDSLGKICEDMMVKCLATDSETGGIGCDNMTVVIIALLGGRTPEEWQAWVKERVENKVGHDTPESVPDIFGLTQPSQNLGGITGAGFRAGGGGLANIASILGASGITFKQPDDSDDDDDDDDLHIIQDDELKPDGYMDGKALEEGTKPVDVTDKLAAEERKTLSSDSKKGSVELLDEDGDSQMDSDSDSTATGAPTNASTPPPQAQAMPIDASPKETSSPRPPSFSSIGSPTVPTPDVLRQFKSSSSSSGERMPDAVRVEGLMDTSENPVKM
ncbi:protein phosphatase PTC2/3, partial [Tremellales sp. Uapishka_1]